ncbi:MAG: hypothetical protein JWM47_3543 [Acidimicrobiales bacterium]|nr:hypothetical protein [Acidimicrobiales bacterium]
MPVETTPMPEVGQPLAPHRRGWRILAVVVGLAIALFWIWIFAGGPEKANPDRLQDRAYVEQAQQRCEALRTDLDALPQASTAATADERADVVERANRLVQAMVADIEADAPTADGDREVLDRWFDDWHAYLDDRAGYVDALRADPDAKFLVTENDELHDTVDRTIEVFADVNDMPACATPGDVG